MDNLEIWNKYKTVPANAQKPFDNGKFKGTDINTMWRLKCLTEQFGPCGKGWYYVPKRLWTEECKNGDVFAFAEIELFVKYDNEWSMPISGNGGNKLVRITKTGISTSDEAFKMAVTDAIGVACKSLGIGADTYWANDKTKYSEYAVQPKPASEFNKKIEEATHGNELHCSECDEVVSEKVAKYSLDKFGRVLCYNCQKKPKEQTKIEEVDISGDELPF